MLTPWTEARGGLVFPIAPITCTNGCAVLPVLTPSGAALRLEPGGAPRTPPLACE